MTNNILTISKSHNNPAGSINTIVGNTVRKFNESSSDSMGTSYKRETKKNSPQINSPFLRNGESFSDKSSQSIDSSKAAQSYIKPEEDSGGNLEDMV